MVNTEYVCVLVRQQAYLAASANSNQLVASELSQFKEKEMFKMFKTFSSYQKNAFHSATLFVQQEVNITNHWIMPRVSTDNVNVCLKLEIISKTQAKIFIRFVLRQNFLEAWNFA